MNHGRQIVHLFRMRSTTARSGQLKECLFKRGFSFTSSLWNDGGNLKVQSQAAKGDIKSNITSRSPKQTDLFEMLAEETGKHDKETFAKAIALYAKKEQIYKRGHVEFINNGLDRMKLFGVHRDIQVYKMLIDLFPKGKMIPKNSIQVEFRHYPKQQSCCLDILEKMEDNGVVPDNAIGELIASAFGYDAHPFLKYRRLMYWMPKLKNANPFPIPPELPDDPILLAGLVMKRMAADFQNRVQIYQTETLGSSVDSTYIVSGQSPTQKELLENHPKQTPVYVEGAFDVWIRNICMKYFILRSDVTEKYKKFENYQEENPSYIKTFNFNWNFMQEEPAEVIVPPSVHEQSDGTILAMCITGTSSRDSLASWIKFLEQDNPALSEIPVAFLLKTSETGLAVIDGEKPLTDNILKAKTT